MINTINTLKAKELHGKKKGKLSIAGCVAVAESYGIYLEPKDKPTLAIYFSFNNNQWVIEWAMEKEPKALLPKNVKRAEFIKAIEKVIGERK